MGPLGDACVPQPIDDCLRVLGNTLCHQNYIPPTVSIHAARNAEHAVRGARTPRSFGGMHALTLSPRATPANHHWRIKAG